LLADSLKERLDADVLKVIADIEANVVKLIHGANLPIHLENISKHYGTQSNKPNAPFDDSLTEAAIRSQMTLVRAEWNRVHGQESIPNTCDEVVEMLKTSFQSYKGLDDWEREIPLILKLLQLASVIAATSAFAERTFSLARRLKTYLRANMRDERFNQLGLLAWYDDELLDIIKLEPIGNNYIQEKPDHRKKMFGQSFSSSDFEHKYFN